MTQRPFLNILILAGLLTLPLALGRGPAVQAAPDLPIHYVKPAPTGAGNCSSWADACGLQTALTDAVPGDEIWVAQGVYKPTTMTSPPDARSATFQLKSGVALYGGFDPYGGADSFDERDWRAYPTVLSGDICTVGDSSENAYHVVTGSGVDATAKLDGFIITAGNANANSPWDSGGGIYNNNGSPTITNISFSGNHAWLRGGGMFNVEGSNPHLVNVTFSGNSADYGGGMYNNNSSLTLTDATFSGNSAGNIGGGMYNYYSNPTLTDVTFSGNSAGNIGGGMYNYHSSPTLTDATFSGNSAEYDGGGMYNYWSSPTLTDATFSGNSAEGGGGMYNYYYSSPTLANAILWGNTAPTGGQIFNDISIPVIFYSDIQGSNGSGASWDTTLGADGGGNIDANPQFARNPSQGGDGDWGTADDDYGNLRLQLISPAIDAGDNEAVPLDVTTDLGGGLRFVNVASVPDTGKGIPPIVDMGAYEVQNLVFVPLVKR